LKHENPAQTPVEETKLELTKGVVESLCLLYNSAAITAAQVMLQRITIGSDDAAAGRHAPSLVELPAAR
jgi:hypothetical protein